MCRIHAPRVRAGAHRADGALRVGKRFHIHLVVVVLRVRQTALEDERGDSHAVEDPRHVGAFQIHH